MPEDFAAYLSEDELNRPFAGNVPKEVLTVFFYWDTNREAVMYNYVNVSTDHDQNLQLIRELINLFFEQRPMACGSKIII